MHCTVCTPYTYMALSCPPEVNELLKLIYLPPSPEYTLKFLSSYRSYQHSGSVPCSFPPDCIFPVFFLCVFVESSFRSIDFPSSPVSLRSIKSLYNKYEGNREKSRGNLKKFIFLAFLFVISNYSSLYNSKQIHSILSTLNLVLS